MDTKNPRNVLLALCDNYSLIHYLHLATIVSGSDPSLTLTARTWRRAVQCRYIGGQFRDAPWTDLGFVRTVLAASVTGGASALSKELCSPLWIQLLLRLLRGETDPEGHTIGVSGSLVVQLQAVKLFQVLLPHWQRSPEEQKDILFKLVEILADHALLNKPDPVLESAHSQSPTSQGKNQSLNIKEKYSNGKLSKNRTECSKSPVDVPVQQ